MEYRDIKLPDLIRVCLAKRVELFPNQYYGVLSRHDKYGMPVDELEKLSEEQLNSYVKGLYLTSCEMASDRTRGHKLLHYIGFEETRQEVGSRAFISVRWPTPDSRPSNN